MNNNRRVVITGMGVMTPLGNDLETFWSNLKNGVSGIRRIEAIDPSPFDCQIGGEVRDFDPKSYFKNPKDIRRTDRFAQLAMADPEAFGLALRQIAQVAHLGGDGPRAVFGPPV